MKIKEGVQLLGLQPQMTIAAMVADRIWENQDQLLVITCGVEGKHVPGSKHNTGCALDFRTRYFSDSQIEFVEKELVEYLGSEFDVIVHKTHIHVEWDPKTGVNL